MILSKNEYPDWKETQNEYGEKYKTNLIPLICDEVIAFFEVDFNQEENKQRTTYKVYICFS